MQLQQTVRKSYSFEGKGLHTGKVAKMTVLPAPADTGLVFRRIDLEGCPEVEALAENVSNTARSTTISKGAASVSTIEHILSALTGMGVDNAIIEMAVRFWFMDDDWEKPTKVWCYFRMKAK